VEERSEITEDHPLKGDTPYAASKIKAEHAVQDWCTKNEVLAVILRLPLVVGEHPPGNLGAIYKAIKDKVYLRITGNKARKSAVLASDVAALIPRLEGKAGIFNLTDGVHPLFSDIETALEKSTGNRIKVSLPVFVMYGFAWFGNFLKLIGLPAPLTNSTLRKMLSTLTFSDAKARKELGWTPNPVVPWIETHLT
jgi:nucleoside-diphosphate-sugar epimerase